MRLFLSFFLAFPVLLLVGCNSSGGGTGSQYKELDSGLRGEVQALGIRNWIVIADQSFPLHTRRGVRTLLVDQEIPEVLSGVVKVVEARTQITPVFYRNLELGYVENDSAPGIDQYRNSVNSILQKYVSAGEVRDFEARELSVVLEDDSKSFGVLVIKTKTALPYSAIYIELESSQR